MREVSSVLGPLPGRIACARGEVQAVRCPLSHNRGGVMNGYVDIDIDVDIDVDGREAVRHAADTAAAKNRAVADSRRLLQEHWSRWCAERGLDPVAPETEPPVVHQVGMDAADAQWVALIRFEVTVAGRHWHGLARGPLDEPVFRVERSVDRPAGGAAPGRPRGSARRWRRHSR